jgi:cysteine desulfurase
MIYLDHAATTPVFPGALEAAWPWLTSEFGNPSSTHELGLRASAALEDARRAIANWLEVSAHEVVFTSGGTEGDNLCVIGLALANPRGRHIISARTEHEAVLGAVEFLERVHDFEVTWLDVDDCGRITLEQLDRELRDDTTLVTLMHANNEIGTIHPISEIAQRVRAVGALMHTDAVQSAGWLDVRPKSLGVDALTVSGHKLGSPKGSGFVYLRRGVSLEPLLHGGGQEDDRRSGTENVAWAVALATAITTVVPSGDAREVEATRVTHLRDSLVHDIIAAVPEARVSGDANSCLPSIAAFTFAGINGESILLELESRGVLVSSGAACAAGKDDPSHVLLACGSAPDTARTAVRVSLAHTTTETEVAEATRALIDAVDQVRSLRT